MSRIEVDLKDLTKARLAELMDCSAATVRYYCNNLYYEELKQIGYRTTQKKFTPKQWLFLLEKLVVIEDELSL